MFKEWNTKIDGTGSGYKVGEKFKNLTTENNGVINFYAILSPISYRVIFNSNDGNNETIEQVLMYNQTVNLFENTFNNTGYKFKEWNTKTDGTGISYSDGQLINITEDLTLYAQWEEETGYVINKYTVDDSNKYIDKIDINTSVDTFKNNIKLNTGYSLDINYKTIGDKNLLYTGGKTKVYNNNNLVIEYTNIVTGDVNGDGKISVLDIVKVNNHIVDESKKLDTIYTLAGDFNGDNKLSVLDIVKINNAIIGGN